MWLVCIGLAIALSAQAQHAELPQVTAADTAASPTDTAVRKTTVLTRVLNYFRNSNKATDKKFDFGVLPGPHYSSTVGFGLGVVASGTYSLDRADTLLPRSNVSLYGDITSKGFLMVGLRGSNIFPHDRFRLDYRLYVYTFPTLFYGIGYENGNNDANKSDYRRLKFDWMGRFLIRVAKNTYVGPTLNFQFIRATEMAPRGEELRPVSPLPTTRAISCSMPSVVGSCSSTKLSLPRNWATPTASRRRTSPPVLISPLGKVAPWLSNCTAA